MGMGGDMKIVFSVRVNLFDNNNDNDVDDGSGNGGGGGEKWHGSAASSQHGKTKMFIHLTTFV